MAKADNARRLFGPEFKPMLAKSFEPQHAEKFHLALEPKIDGLRVVAIVRNGAAVFVSRNGLAFPALNHLAAGVVATVAQAGLDNVALDCEAITGDFAKSSGDIRKLDSAATDTSLHVFDIVPAGFILGETGQGRMLRYFERRQLLINLCRGAPSFLQLVESRDIFRKTCERDIESVYREFRAAGFEGAMAKNVDGFYSRGRSGDWLKMKAAESYDMRVTGLFEGAGKFAGTLGGLVCDLDGVAVEIGTGFTNDERDSIWRNPSRYIGRILEATAQEKTAAGSLRHPRFFRWRDDKAA